MKKLLLLMIMLFSTMHIYGGTVSVVNLTSRTLLFDVVYLTLPTVGTPLPPREQGGHASISRASYIDRVVVRHPRTGEEIARHVFRSQPFNSFVEIREDGRQIIASDFGDAIFTGCISYAVNFAPFDIEVNFDFRRNNLSIPCPGEFTTLRPYEVIRIVRRGSCRIDFVFARDKPNGIEISNARFTKKVCNGAFLFLPVNGATRPTKDSIRIIDIF